MIDNVILKISLTLSLSLSLSHTHIHTTGSLAQFLDYITYGYMIDNVILLLTGTLHERDTRELLEKCHPLGKFQVKQHDATHCNILKRTLCTNEVRACFSKNATLSEYFW